MKYLAIICILISQLSCQTKKQICCNENDIIISDIYSVEYENKSRYVCINGIPGKVIQSKYLSTEQIHVFEYEDYLITVNFYHSILKDKEYRLDTNAIRTINFEFGVLQIMVNTENKEMVMDSITAKAVNDIRVKYFENVDLCYGNSSSVIPIPNALLNIGVINYEMAQNRKILTIKLSNNSTMSMIETLFKNLDLIYNHLDDKDLIRFESSGSSRKIIRSYIMSNSKGFQTNPNDWCSMGPNIKKFECIYINNYDL